MTIAEFGTNSFDADRVRTRRLVVLGPVISGALLGEELTMGKLVYDGIEIEFNDRVLAHVQVVIGNKLRRSEGFFFSWHDSGDIGDGRSSVWLHDAIPLYFKFFGSKAPVLNREWLEILTLSANSGTGLLLSSEPEMPGSSGK